jgi:hypothetical protein
MSEEQRQAAWRAETENLLKQTNEENNEFRCRILPEALAVEREVSRRLGRQIATNNHRVVALRHGMLAGPSPVADAADYLELMARDL